MSEKVSTISTTTRAEKRRLFVDYRKKLQYEASKFIDLSSYVGNKFRLNKYVPHIGKKQREKGL